VGATDARKKGRFVSPDDARDFEVFLVAGSEREIGQRTAVTTRVRWDLFVRAWKAFAKRGWTLGCLAASIRVN